MDKRDRESLTQTEIPPAIKEAFRKIGGGCLAVETNEGIILLARASDVDVDGFANKPVTCRWQHFEMPTASLIRFHLTILDRPQNPTHFATFFDIANPESGAILWKQLEQETLILVFLGDDLEQRFSIVLPFPDEQREDLRQLIARALDWLLRIPEEKRDFGLAKAQFQAEVGLEMGL